MSDDTSTIESTIETTMQLSTEDRQKANDLLRQYGSAKRVSDILNIEFGLIEPLYRQQDDSVAQELSDRNSARIRNGIRRCWKTWMGK